MYKVQYYIGGERLELFKDETLSLNSTVQNIRDISRVFTDFTQSFTVPASSVNNLIFKHWYNADITGGFDASTRAASAIELNYFPFRIGVTQLEEASIRDGKVHFYKITFFGNVVKLSDLFGDDGLSVLDLTTYTHFNSSALVKSGMTGTILTGNIIYPLAFIRNVTMDSQGTSLASSDIKYDTGSQSYGIDFLELKPAIKINKIIIAIETKYSITFSDDFFNASNHFDKLFLWLNNSKERMRAPTALDTIIWDNIISNDGNYAVGTGKYIIADTSSHTYTSSIVATAGYLDVEYTVNLVHNTTVVDTKTGTGNTTVTSTFAGVVSDTVFVQIQAKTTMLFTGTYVGTTSLFSVATTAAFTINGVVVVADQMPKITVSEFLSGLFKAFNLVIIPTGATTFDIKTLDSWYTAGKTTDITQYVSLDSITIKRPNLNSEIKFLYQETDTIIGEKFRNQNSGVGYGDLRSEFTFDGPVLEIKLPFENIVGERITRTNNNALTNVHIHHIIDSKLDAIEIEPFIFYNKGTFTVTPAIGFINADRTVSSVSAPNTVGQSDNSVQASITQSLNWGSEIDTFTLESVTESLFTNFWTEYITDLYNTKRRLFAVTAQLPLGIISNLELNDKLLIRDRKYIINNMKTNLTTGEVKFELLNDI